MGQNLLLKTGICITGFTLLYIVCTVIVVVSLHLLSNEFTVIFGSQILEENSYPFTHKKKKIENHQEEEDSLCTYYLHPLSTILLEKYMLMLVPKEN